MNIRQVFEYSYNANIETPINTVHNLKYNETRNYINELLENC